ncbi:MAG: mannose-6-phosphate isomerase, partial [Mucilaginibacter sp.]|nr:mannose-6-phosphate isomerase [Mucilaginibacter sp.]
SNLDSFVIHVCVEGEYVVKHNNQAYPVKMGECILLPKTIDKVELETNTGFKILESFIE